MRWPSLALLSHAQSNSLGSIIVIMFQDMSRYGTLDIRVLFCLIQKIMEPVSYQMLAIIMHEEDVKLYFSCLSVCNN